jgi:hypothetical protein
VTAPSGAAGDVNGRARAITLVTSLRPLGRVVNPLLFAAQRIIPKTLGIRELGSIYFTRWSIVRTIPYNGAPQVREHLAPPILVWETDFNGLVEPYIETFTHVIPRQIRAAWGRSYGFPGTRSVTALQTYIETLKIPNAYNYTAYPEATVRMVLSALAVAREHRFLLECSECHVDPLDFASAYRGFLIRRQGDL